VTRLHSRVIAVCKRKETGPARRRSIHSAVDQGTVDELFDVYVGIVPHRERAHAVPDLVTIAPPWSGSEGFPGDDGAIPWDVKVGLVERVAVAFVECDPPWPATRCRCPFHEVPVSSDYMYR
jgi:hypothetical protein